MTVRRMAVIRRRGFHAAGTALHGKHPMRRNDVKQSFAIVFALGILSVAALDAGRAAAQVPSLTAP